MRKPIEVDKAAFIAAVEEAEKNGPLKNLQELQERVADIYNQNHAPTITKGVVYLRLKEFGVEHQTKAGKRGGGDGSHLRSGKRGPRTSREEKFNANQGIQASFERMEVVLRSDGMLERYGSLLDKMKKGSMASAVKLNCLECSAYVTSEVKHCACSQCPLWPFRPYQYQVEEKEVEEKEAA